MKNKDSMEKDQVETKMEETKKLIEKDKDVVPKDKDSAEEVKNSVEKNKSSIVSSTAKKVSSQSNNVKKGDLDNFFGKLTSPSKCVEPTSEKKNDNDKEESTEKKANKEKRNLHGKKRNRSKETDKIAKKRKRIAVLDDSSDSEIQSDIEMEESVLEIESETLAKPEKKNLSPQKVKYENGKKKVLKLVSKAYKEGEYIVTKKDYVYVSCSEDEEEKKEMKRRDEEKKKKVETKIDKVKKKQSTLTDFFKRS